jgi:glycolate oxidase iron-sulfur subunit
MTSSQRSNFFESVSDVDLATCVGCGLCLPHCPTFRVTGEDALSPRGRIELIKSVKSGELTFNAEVEHALNTCIQCRGCEPACPSGVPYGRIIEHALIDAPQKKTVRTSLVSIALKALTKPRLLRFVTKCGYLAQCLHALPKSLSLPKLSFRLPPLRLRNNGKGPEVVLFTGCIMDVAYRPVHQASISLLEALGYQVSTSEAMGSCCGALHEHAGQKRTARRIHSKLRNASAGKRIVVNSAGCGASLKASLAGVAEVLDIHELLAQHTDEIARWVTPQIILVAVQDPCHLRHVQKAHRQVHDLLRLCYEVIEIPDDGLCCGAGGAFSVIQQKMALEVRNRKEEVIRDAVSRAILNEYQGWCIASANPGCSGFLADAGLVVEHPVVLLHQACSSTNVKQRTQ